MLLAGSRGKFPYHRGSHLIVKLDELWVYADESGLERSAPHCLLTGFIASPQQWASFERDWKKVLRSFGVPDFHAKVFFWRHQKVGSRENYYDGWSAKKADRFLDKLLDAVRVHELFPVGGSVDVDAFRSFCIGERRLLTGGIVGAHPKTGRLKWLTSGAPGKPYFAVFHWLLVEAMRLAEIAAPLGGNDLKVHFVFDLQQQMEGGARATFRDLVKMVGPLDERVKRLGLISYGKREDHMGLQAADLHAFAWASYITRGEELSPERRRVMDAMTTMKNRVANLDSQGMTAMFSTLSPEILAFIRNTPEQARPKS